MVHAHMYIYTYIHACVYIYICMHTHTLACASLLYWCVESLAFSGLLRQSRAARGQGGRQRGGSRGHGGHGAGEELAALLGRDKGPGSYPL